MSYPSVDHLQHDLAHGLPALQYAVRVPGIGQRQDMVYAQLKPPLLDRTQDRP